MKVIFTNCFKLQLVLFFAGMFVISGCAKEVIADDEGESHNYNPEEITPGVLFGDVYVTKNFAAFTDITFYRDEWYIAFRAGTKHEGGTNGQVKILKSIDGVTWKVDQIIKIDSLDLRDPKFFIDTPNNRLYTQFTGLKAEGNIKTSYNFMAPYNQNSEWGLPVIITNNNPWNERYNFWRSIYSKGKAYCAAYRVPIFGGYTTDNICLFTTNNNTYNTYDTIGKLNLGKSPNEATIRFAPDGKMYFLIRREVAHVALGYSQAPNYTKVTWIENALPLRLSSPNFLFYKNNLLICGRDQDELTFKFFSYNSQTNKVEKEFSFPSGLETGYGGMSFNPKNEDELWISYYAIMGEKSHINLVKMNLKTFLQ